MALATTTQLSDYRYSQPTVFPLLLGKYFHLNSDLCFTNKGKLSASFTLYVKVMWKKVKVKLSPQQAVETYRVVG
jgi:hypothetical protein